MTNSIIEAVVGTIADAAAKFGSDVVAGTVAGDVDGRLRLARNLVARLRIVPEYGAVVVDTVGGMAERPDAIDGVDGLRMAVEAAVAVDGSLASDLAIVMSDAGV
jgi:hypothetical protein